MIRWCFFENVNEVYVSAVSADLSSTPSWFVEPGGTDIAAWFVVALLLAALYGVVFLYASFDRWAEHQSRGTPLARTIPTMLAIALIYEVFPLDHFHLFLPLCAILIALAADWSRYRASVHKAPSPTTQATSEALAEDVDNDV
ncbi:MAG: hypothetical protein AAF749_04700 [Pseudomonadota bacterium]